MENIETLLAAVAQTQGFDDDEPSSTVSASASPPKLGFENHFSRASISAPVTNQAPETAMTGGDKRKRGRPPRGAAAAVPPPQKRKKLEDEEEDVCFICFDGGTLVLCDRKGCPKAYHPACIKRDEAFFKSKAKWNCGWHICSVCRKASHYMCYTCTYSVCKGCTRIADYVSVRGNKGFCPTCMKMIMLIENKDHAANEGVQVDFDDKGSWEYLFKVYWVILKEKLSLTLSEITQARKPWKGMAADHCSPQHHMMVDGKTTVSCRSTEPLELNKPPVEIPQNHGSKTESSGVYNQVVELKNKKGEEGINLNTDTEMPSVESVADTKKMDNAFEELGFKEGIEKDTHNHVILGIKACISSDIKCGDLSKPEKEVSAAWASKDLLEFVGHMRNGDTSALSQFDVQQLLLDYIKRNNLRDPHQKSRIICDQRLRNIFGKPRVGHIEMLKLLEYHFLAGDDSQNSSFIPAGFVGSAVSRIEVDGNSSGLSTPKNTRKRKIPKKSEERAPTVDLNEYAAIDVHNINLIFLRRNLVENLVQDQENFSGKVVGSIVRIRVSSNDQKQDVYRLVQVVGTTKVKEPYKIGEKTTDVMLEVLNLTKKEIVSIDAISNQDYTEEECRRLRQSIRCELVKHFTVGEILDRAMALLPVRVDDWLDTEISRLNHLRDRASEKGRKKELRECVEKLQILKSPEERLRRISETPVVHADPKMNPAYESEEDTRIDRYPLRSSNAFSGNGRKSTSPKRKVKEAGSILAQNRVLEKTDARDTHNSDKHLNQANSRNSFTEGKSKSPMTSSSKGNTASAHIIETEKLWHYRDPNGRIQGPFAMMQLRKWSMSRLFPPNMRIWTNHEQYDSLLLADALNGKFHEAPEFSHNSYSGSQTNEAAEKCRENVRIDAAIIGDNKQAETVSHATTITEHERANESTSSASPQCIDLMKDINATVDDDAQASAKLPHSSLQESDAAVPVLAQKGDELNHGSKSGEEKNSLIQKLITSDHHELHEQNNNHDRARLSSEEKLRLLFVDLVSDPVEFESAPVTLPDSRKSDADEVGKSLAEPTLKTGGELSDGVEKHQDESPNVGVQNTTILELLSPTPRSNGEDCSDHHTQPRQSSLVTADFSLADPGSSWPHTVQGLQIPEIGNEWCGYSPTPARPSSVQEFMSEILTANLSPNPHGSPSHPPPPPSSSNLPNWLSNIAEPIEFVALGEESVSDLLAEVDAMESRGLASPNSAMKFARDLFQDCKDDCFSSIEDFSHTAAAAHGPVRSDAFSSTGVTSQSSIPCKPITQPPDALDSTTFRRSMGLSSASSEGENNNVAPAISSEAGSEFHPPLQNNNGPENMDPGWGTVQGNINLVTVQGNVNLVLGGPTQGMTNLGWGANPGPGNWVNPSINCSPINPSLPWDGQRKYGGERYTSPREWGGYVGGGGGEHGRGRPPPWGRQPYGGGGGGAGGYSRAIPRGQRVCKFYESGHCKKGAFCDYLHP